MTYFPNTTYNKSKIASLDGSSDYMLITAAEIKTAATSTNNGGDDASELNPTKDESFTVSAWSRLDATNTGDCIVSKCNLGSAEDGWMVGNSGTYVMQFSIDGASGTAYRRAHNLNDFEYGWKHNVFVYDHTIAGGSGNTAQTASCLLYLNGSDFSSTGATAAKGEIQVVGTDAGSFNIGRSNFSAFYGNGYWGGYLSEVSYWNAALSAEEIQELFNGGRPSDLKLHTKVSNLKGWWLGGDGTVSFSSNYTVQDSSGSGFHMTSAGMADGSIINGTVAV